MLEHRRDIDRVFQLDVAGNAFRDVGQFVGVVVRVLDALEEAQRRVLIADLEEHANDGEVTKRIFVNEVNFQWKVFAIDGIFRWSMKMELNQFVTVIKWTAL